MLLFYVYILYTFIGYKFFENLFSIKRLKIRGIRAFTAEEIFALSGIAQGSSLFNVSTSEIRQNLEKHPRIGVLEVKKIYPDTLRIVIRENTGEILLAQRSGSTMRFYEIGKEYFEARGHKILETGWTVENCNKIFVDFESGQDVVKNGLYVDNAEIVFLIKAVGELPEAERDVLQAISQIYYRKDGEIVLYSREAKIPIYIGLEVTAEKLRRVRYALLYVEKNNYKIDRIDLRFNTAKFELKRG
ncbi:cell division protein FtsQ/DivIB [Spirochaetota bacterium]